jgi:hypothetical protein
MFTMLSFEQCIISAHVDIGKFTLSHTIELFIYVN